MPRSSLLFFFAASLAACSGSTPDDGSPFRPSDAHHDETTSTGDDETTTTEDDSGTIDDDTSSTPDDTSTGDEVATDTGFTCPDDHYDVNGNPGDGCEVVDTQYHTTASAYSFGSVGECDSSYGWVQMSHFYASDERTHEPSGANGANGKAQYITATLSSDTFCQDDPSWQITTTGGSVDSVYRITVYPNNDLSHADTACSPNTFSGEDSVGPFLCNGMNDGEPVMIKLEKVSGPAETISYTFQYHN